MNTPIDSTEPSPTMTPSATSERAPMKQLSSMMVGAACNGSSTPPMPAPPEMWQCAADLRAGADGRPGVDHRVLADMGADIDEAGHQHGALGDKGRAAHDGAGTARKPAARNRFSSQPANLESTLSHQRRVARRAFDQLHVVEPEGQQHGLLQPLMHMPLAAVFLGDAQRAGVEILQRRLDRVAHLALGIRADAVARLPGIVDRCGRGFHSAMSDPDGVEKDGEVASFVIDIGRVRGLPGDWPSPSLSHTVVMPSACAGARLRGVSSNRAARAGRDAGARDQSRHRPPAAAWG